MSRPKNGFNHLGRQIVPIAGSGEQHLEEWNDLAITQRVHLWVGNIMTVMEDDALRKLTKATLEVDPEKLIRASIGCLICNLAYKPQLVGTICKGVSA